MLTSKCSEASAGLACSRGLACEKVFVCRYVTIGIRRAKLFVTMTRTIGRVVFVVCLVFGMTAVGRGQSTSPGIDVLTHRYDTWRTGANLAETTLTVKKVAGQHFGKIFEREVDGDIFAQPLIKTGVVVPGVGTRNIVYVATVNNSLFAFDADTPGAGKPLWCVGKAVFGEPVPKTEVVDLPAPLEYLNFDTKIGIVGTPVIDPDSSTIYVVAFSKTNNNEHRFRIHAFDLASGREKTEMHSPMTVEASYLGNGVGSVDGKIRFDPRKMLNRPALLLVDGTLYLAFTAHLDGEPKFDYHGWIMAYNAKTLKQLALVNTTPDGIQGGIWQSGGGLSAEKREGTYPLIYAVVSNGSVGGRNYAESLMQLYPAELMSTKQVFVPGNHEFLNDRDLDLSTAPLLIPDLPLAIVCSKEGKCYVVDRADMHLVQEFQAGVNSYGGERTSNIHGAPVAWRDDKGVLRLFLWGEEDYLRSFQFTGTRFVGAGKSKMRAPEKSMPGGMLTLSSNGSIEGTAIVWASVPVKGDANIGTVEGILRAFDASNVEIELWNSSSNEGRDGLGMFAKFCPPAVANGKVYMATFAEPSKAGQTGHPNKLVVYGLLPGN